MTAATGALLVLYKANCECVVLHKLSNATFFDVNSACFPNQQVFFLMIQQPTGSDFCKALLPLAFAETEWHVDHIKIYF